MLANGFATIAKARLPGAKAATSQPDRERKFAPEHSNFYELPDGPTFGGSSGIRSGIRSGIIVLRCHMMAHSKCQQDTVFHDPNRLLSEP